MDLVELVRLLTEDFYDRSLVALNVVASLPAPDYKHLDERFSCHHDDLLILD
jgi:hypothetical protein